MLRNSLVAAVLLVSAGAHADAPELERVRAMLSAFEGGPSAEAWQALGPETVAMLEQLFDDQGQEPFVRLRAVEAAGHFATDDSRAFLRRVATTSGQGDLIVRAALRSMARAFGASALSDIQPFLRHRLPVVREGAALALGAIPGPRARAALQARLEIERDSTVRTTLRRALSN